MSTVVGQKGQVTIERPIREALGIAAGWRAVQRAENGALVIHFLPPKHRRSLAGTLADATTVRAASEEELNRAIDEAWGGAEDEDDPGTTAGADHAGE
jgi:bifunctional DNA-binding transcriptional regulator/antitoxin component of YhaV-PrlF toxin-antitoxin module